MSSGLEERSGLMQRDVTTGIEGLAAGTDFEWRR